MYSGYVPKKFTRAGGESSSTLEMARKVMETLSGNKYFSSSPEHDASTFCGPTPGLMPCKPQPKLLILCGETEIDHCEKISITFLCIAI